MWLGKIRWLESSLRKLVAVGMTACGFRDEGGWVILENLWL
jgi:hypothetical protein